MPHQWIYAGNKGGLLKYRHRDRFSQYAITHTGRLLRFGFLWCYFVHHDLHRRLSLKARAQ